MSSSRRMAVTLATAIAVLVAAFGLPVLAAAPATADSAPPAGTPATVTADGLKTWQINGVVWNQAVVGNTVYAVGSFTAARPPGSAVGVNEIPAGNIFAYDITTGNPVANFSHSLNGQALGIAKSPDGSTIYVVGDFTTVDGIVRNHVASFDTATGALNSFAPSANGQVRTVATDGSTVWLGGNFSKLNNAVRTRLGAVSVANSTTALPWAPTADDNIVSAMVLTPDGTRVIVGGMFTSVNGTPTKGMGSLDAVSGASMPWAANQTIRDGSAGSSITSLTTDGTNIYGSGYSFRQGGNFEGTFGADPNTGALVLVNDCHGDTYGTFPNGGVLYTVSHSHDCRWIGAYPQTDADWSINQRKAVAFTIAPKSVNTGPDNYGYNYNGLPASQVLQWFPVLDFGSYTTSAQAAWSVSGNSQYVVLGGEFPKVNGVAQQGLVRFAVSSIAPNKRGPQKVTTTAAPNPAIVAPSVTATSPGRAKLTWQAAVDQDNRTLTYTVSRSDTPTPVYTTTQDSSFWSYPTMTFQDSGLVAGQAYTYTITATDPFGNALTIGTLNVTATGGTTSTYSKDVVRDGARAYWRLGESTGATVFDYAGTNDATASGGVALTRRAPGAINGDTDTAYTFNGANALVVSPQMAAPAAFSVEAWVKTTSTRGGKIVGYGSANTNASANTDRHLYMDNTGKVWFGVNPGVVRTVNSAQAYNDGQWHHVVGTQGAAGMALYIDGKRVATDPTTTTAAAYSGYWHIGGDRLVGWPNQPTSNALAGSIDDVAVYPSALSLARVQQHYLDSGRTIGGVTAPTDAYGQAVFGSSPDLYWRLNEPAGTTAADSSVNGQPGSVSGTVTQGVASGVAGGGTAYGFDGATATIGSPVAIPGPSVYSEELWFNTTSTQGGKLIGFGNAQSGLSTNTDRNLFLQPSGQLTFGVLSGASSSITTARRLNDGRWHHVVATQGPSGMRLYVDGNLLGSNAQTSQQAFSGFWRVGGDTGPAGSSSFLAGTIDEVSVYSTELTQADVVAHFQAGGGTVVANQAPTAAFTATPTDLSVAVDASASTDDGAIVSYAWSWGDGTADGSGPTASHAYAAGGTYTVKLTLTDDQGATSTLSKLVTATPAASPTLATDSFARTVTSGWGAADLGGSWAAKTGFTSNFSVAGGVGTITMTKAGNSPQNALSGLSSTTTDSTVTMSVRKLTTGGGIYGTLIGRNLDATGTGYKATLNFRSTGALTLSVVRRASDGTETALAPAVTVPGITYAGGDQIKLRLVVTSTNPTTVQARVWRAGTTEPTTWLVNTTDATAALQAPGSVGFIGFLSGSATDAPAFLDVDDLKVVKAG